MKKTKTLIPLIAMLAMLASCGNTASSLETSSMGESQDTPAESSTIDASDDSGSGSSSSSRESSTEPEGSELAMQLELLSLGYDVDITLDDGYCGSIALNDEGVRLAYDGEEATHYVPEALEDEPGTWVDYVAEAYIDLSNEVVTDVYYWMEWDSIYLNFFSMLTEEDFVSLGNGIYVFYPEEDDFRSEYASCQLTLETADPSDISEIVLSLSDGEMTEMTIAAGSNTYVAFVNALGGEVDTLLKPYEGESIEEIDDIVSKIQEGNYTLREEYLFEDESGEYVVDDDYTSDIFVSDSLAYDGWYELGYMEYEEGVYELAPVTDENGTTWYVNTDFYGYSWWDMVGGCRISSKLFEETLAEGTYSLISDIPCLHADVASYDPYASGYVTDLIVTINEDGSLSLTCDYDGDYLITVTYYDIGTTVLPDETLTKANVCMIKMGDYYDSICDIADKGYDFATGLGTDDRNLWKAAFECVDLPYYGLDGVAFGKAEGFDPFLADHDAETTTPYSIYIKYLYAYYDEDYEGYYYDFAYFYFAEYMYEHGFEETYEESEDGEGYYVYTAPFEYGSETHTVSIVDLGACTTGSDTTIVDELFIVKIDMALPSEA